MAKNVSETVFTGDSSGLIQAYQEQVNANKRMEEQLRDLKRAAKEAHNEEKQGLREADRMYREVQSPLERYRENVQRVDEQYQKGNISQETYNRQMDRQKDLLKENSSQLDGAAAAAKNFIAGFAGLAGIQKLLQMIGAELENMKQRQMAAAATQLQVAEAEREALKNFGPERGQDLIEMSKRIQGRTGGDRVHILGALSTTSSKLGVALGDEELEAAVTTGARLSPGNQGGMTESAAAIITQQKQTGGTAAGIAGQQMAAKRLSPVASDEAFGANVAPGAVGLMKLGLTDQQAFGLMAAAGSAAEDSTGQTTANAMLNLMVQLKTKAPQFANPYDALQYIRSDEGAELRKELLGPLEKDLRESATAVGPDGKVGLTGEKKFLPFTVDLLQPQTNATQESVERSVRRIPGQADAADIFERDMSAIEAMDNQVTAGLYRQLSAAAQSAELLNVDEGRASVAREGMQKYLKAMGVSAAGQKFAGVRFEASTQFGTDGDAVEFVEDELEARAAELRRGQMVSAGVGAAPVNVAPSERDLRDAEAFAALATELQMIRERIEQQTEQQRDIADKPVRTENANPQPPAAAQSR